MRKNEREKERKEVGNLLLFTPLFSCSERYRFTSKATVNKYIHMYIYIVRT